MNSVIRTVVLCAAAACLAPLAGCATPAEPEQAPRAIVAEPTTGSNIPRRDRKGGVSGVTIMNADAFKEATNKPQAPAVTN